MFGRIVEKLNSPKASLRLWLAVVFFALVAGWILVRDLSGSLRVRPAHGLQGERAALSALYCDILPPIVSDALFTYALWKESDPQAKALLTGTVPTPEQMKQLPGAYRLMAEYREHPTEEMLARLRSLGYSSLQRFLLCLSPILVLVGSTVFVLALGERSGVTSHDSSPSGTTRELGPDVVVLCFWIVGGALLIPPVLGLLATSGKELRVLAGGFVSYGLLASALWMRHRIRAGSSNHRERLSTEKSGNPTLVPMRLAHGIDWKTAASGYLAALILVNLWETLVSTLSGIDLDGRLLALSPLVSTNPAFLFGLSVLGVVVGPYLEELLYRGLLLENLRAGVGTTSAVILSSALFSVSHANAWALPGLLILGSVLALVYLQSGSVRTAYLVHAAWNLTSLCLGVLAL